MEAPDAGDITQALRASLDGDSDAVENLYGLVYADLKRLAGFQHRRSPDAVTLTPTGLVNEAFLRLVNYSNADWGDRNHFFAVASKAMRQVVVDECRRRLAEKRGGGAVHEDIDAIEVPIERRAEAVLAVNEALDELRTENEKLAGVVECRFFAGLTEEETAQATGLSLRSVQRYWQQARGLLRERLEDDFG
ncbi:MAG: ECF-type sigma factor [Pseudomonadota bacterium]